MSCILTKMAHLGNASISSPLPSALHASHTNVADLGKQTVFLLGI